jgi:hypothetical protein
MGPIKQLTCAASVGKRPRLSPDEGEGLGYDVALLGQLRDEAFEAEPTVIVLFCFLEGCQIARWTMEGNA